MNGGWRKEGNGESGSGGGWMNDPRNGIGFSSFELK
jgi:hypothetical protein